MRQKEIRVENARVHNLKGVSCRFPLGGLTVVTSCSIEPESSMTKSRSTRS